MNSLLPGDNRHNIINKFKRGLKTSWINKFDLFVIFILNSRLAVLNLSSVNKHKLQITEPSDFLLLFCEQLLCGGLHG